MAISKPIPKLPRQPRPPTLKQTRFAQRLPFVPSATDAAMETYDIPPANRNMAGVIASQNLRKPAVQAVIAELQEKTTSAKVMSLLQRKERLSRLALPDPEHPDPIRAIDTLNRMESVYVDKSLNLNATLDLTELAGFSLDELKALLGATTQAVPPSRKGP